jgi:hypothetical protein
VLRAYQRHSRAGSRHHILRLRRRSLPYTTLRLFAGNFLDSDRRSSLRIELASPFLLCSRCVSGTWKRRGVKNHVQLITYVDRLCGDLKGWLKAALQSQRVSRNSRSGRFFAAAALAVHEPCSRVMTVFPEVRLACYKTVTLPWRKYQSAYSQATIIGYSSFQHHGWPTGLPYSWQVGLCLSS